MTIQILLAVIVIPFVVLIFLVIIRGREVKPGNIENTISGTWTNLGLEEKIGALAAHTQDIRECHKSIEQMLRVPTEQAALWAS